jgi:hypothetical protein
MGFFGSYMGFLSDNMKSCGNMVSLIVVLVFSVIIWL